MTSEISDPDISHAESSPLMSPQPHRSERNNVPRRWFEIEREDSTLMALFIRDPITMEEAMEREKWRMAMKDKLPAIQKNQM